MQPVSTTLRRLTALTAALVVAAGCASPNRDLEFLRNPRAAIEPVPLPPDIVRAPIRQAAASSTTETSPSDGAREKSEPGVKAPTLRGRLRVPKEFPGAELQELRLPKRENEVEYDDAVRKLFPSLIEPPHLDVGSAESLRPKFTLLDLEQMALANSPVIAQFQSDITLQSGQAIQAGTHPNPIVGYESDTVGSSLTRDYQGVYMSQIIKTAGKLELAQAIENVDVMNAQLELRQARNDLLSQVRRQYFALLVARESLKINQAIERFTHEVYRIQVDQVTEGQAAVYEPMQLRTLAVQARAGLVAAQNRYISAWKQLTATLNVPDLPLGDLADHPDISVPQVDYDMAVTHVLSLNTEARVARNGPMRARLALRLAEITPIPDVFVYGTFQRDYTVPALVRTSYNTQVGIPLPIFDRNKGNILAARGSLVRATEEMTRVQNDLRARLADAFERYENNRTQVGFSREQIIPDSVRTYRATYERHIQAPDDVGFADVIVAQQNMLGAISTYISALTGQWTAFVDIAALLQIESLHELQLQLQEKDAGPEPAEGPDAGNDVTSRVTRMLTVSNAAAATADNTSDSGPEMTDP